jgi:hypothetical protein
MAGMMTDMREVGDEYQEWAADSEVLAQIGRVLFDQPAKLIVSLPRDLAERALASWRRSGIERSLREESPEQRMIRHRAGFLGLIGLSIEHSGGLRESEDVMVELDAWYVGAALEAADDLGLLQL